MEKILGIDLGTSTSCVSVILDGQPYVVPDRNGFRIQPSIVNFQADGRILVGIEAKPYVIQDAENTITSAKRLIGRKIFSSEVKKAKALMPYEIVEGENQSVMLHVRGKDYTLQEISAMILRKMKSIAEQHFKESFSKAVITVPAYFNDNQRAATKDAGKIAGLEVLRIINEPTAAALSYGYGRDIRQRVVVYDLGGGTFDISILELGDGVFEVISTAGDTYLGGDDFDDRIIGWVADRCQEKHGFDLRADRQTLQQVKDAAETAKVELSTKDTANIFIPSVAARSNGFVDIDLSLTRKEFDALVSDLTQKTLKVCDEAMQIARMTPSDIDGVILVGGPTRIPIVRESVRKYFQKDPKNNINPDEVVSMGACIQGSALTGETKDVVLVDLTPMSLGIEIRGGLVERIVDANTPVPVDHTKIFSTSFDQQESVLIRVFQGESRKTTDNEILGEFTLSGLRKARAGEVSVAVQFEIDTNGILNVSAKDLETGKVQAVKLQACGRLSDEELSRASRSAQNVITHVRENVPSPA